MLKNPALGYTPIGLVDDDPRKKNLRLHGSACSTTRELRHLLRDRRPDEPLIAIPSAAGEVRERIVEIARAERIPVKTLPGLPELIAGDYNLAGRSARSRWRTSSAASPSTSTSTRSRAT